MMKGDNPRKIYIFFKNPGSDEITEELNGFMKDYEHRYGGHFFNKFQSVDTLKLEFLLQLEGFQKELEVNGVGYRVQK